MLEKVKESLYRSEILKSGLFLVSMGILGGALSYLYQIIIGKLLINSDLAVFGATMALVSIFTSPSGAVNMILTKKIAGMYAANNWISLKAYYQKLIRIGFALSVLIIFLNILNISYLQDYLKLKNNLAPLLIGPVIIFSIFTSINSAFFQGTKEFTFYGTIGVIWNALKIIFAIFLVKILDQGLDGAIMSSLLPSISIFLIGYLYLWVNKSKKNISQNPSIENINKLKAGDVISILVANVAFTMMTQSDMVLVNYFFSEDLANQYAAAAVLGKAVLYAPGGLVVVLFSLVAGNEVLKKPSGLLVFQSIIFAVILTIPVCGIYFFYGAEIIELFYGNKYVEAGKLLKYYGFAILPIALAQVAEYFLLAKSRMLFIWIFICLAPVEYITIYFFHDSLMQVLSIKFGYGIALVLLGFSILWMEFKGKKFIIVKGRENK
jgi:O-antigen/teichoic acid export membrane protein